MSQITLITATFNSASTLKTCLDSVAFQTITPEHLIIDGCSTDSTLERLSTYTGHDLTVFSEPDKGMYDAMNKGIRKASGEVIGILNADDFYADSSILEGVADVFRNRAVQACYGDLCYVDKRVTEKVIRYWQAGTYDSRKFYWGWMPPHPTFFVRRSVYLQFGDFNLHLGSAADYELMLRFLVRYGLQAAYIPKLMVMMRTGGVSNSALSNRVRANMMDRKAWSVNGLRPYPWTLAMKPLRKLSQWISRKPAQSTTLLG